MTDNKDGKTQGSDKKQNEKDGERLNLLTQMRSEKTKDTKRDGMVYSRFIRAAKYILPLVALAMTAIIIIIADTEEKVQTFLPDVQILKEQKPQNELVKARFESFDDKNQPYSINAQRAIQNPETPDMVNLEGPTADITLQSGSKLSLQAGTGQFQQADQSLQLDNDVVIIQDGGYIFETKDIHLDLKDNTAQGNQDVFVSGPEGQIYASGIIVDHEQNTLIFKGPAKIIITHQSKNLLGP